MCVLLTAVSSSESKLESGAQSGYYMINEWKKEYMVKYRGKITQQKDKRLMSDAVGQR